MDCFDTGNKYGRTCFFKSIVYYHLHVIIVNVNHHVLKHYRYKYSTSPIYISSLTNRFFSLVYLPFDRETEHNIFCI